jgi:hypothetical protein
MMGRVLLGESLRARSRTSRRLALSMRSSNWRSSTTLLTSYGPHLGQLIRHPSKAGALIVLAGAAQIGHSMFPPGVPAPVSP